MEIGPSRVLNDPIVFRRFLQMEIVMQGRFLVRKGNGGWMVYDRERKGPAQAERGGPFAEKLTKEQADTLAQTLRSQPRKPGL
ncbi:hypothetical protein H8A99_14085 [Bradyrhizobium sp. Arg68]|uniref:hypothetical protein n=1 Tax=Bradyrhizobium ivorense TaxID=2511166 RepID=UPI001E2D6862|nr:hypothetical protein [Bradyrhizobium ivorense]MCC8937570.1 hypothetical protein [Bradyrhizobium ivorense]